MDLITVTFNGAEFSSLASAAQAIEKSLTDDVDAGLKQISQAALDTLNKVAAKLAAKHSASWNGGVVNGSDSLQRRTGQGIKSLVDSVKNGSYGKDVVGAEISAGDLGFHEEGGTISAKSAKYLTIPLPAAMDGRGVPLRARARDWENTFVARSKKGNLLIFQKNGNDITPLYLLKSSVTIKPRLGLEKEINDTGLPYFEQRAVDELAKAFGI